MKKTYLLIVVFLVASCGYAPEMSAPTLTPDGWIAPDNFYERTVHFASNRRALEGDAGNPAIPYLDRIRWLDTTTEDSIGDIRYGLVKVRVPYAKPIGKTAGMSISELVYGIGWSNFSQNVASEDLIVFVHGFNTTFSDAAIRAAQMAHDINFEGHSVLFSWPSAGRAREYRFDRAHAEQSAGPLASFLVRVASATDKKIHVVAHSMGNVVLTNAFTNIENSKQVEGIDVQELRSRRSGRLFAQVILASPDLDTDEYVGSYLDHDHSQLARQITLYSTHNDIVLKGSRLLNFFEDGSNQARLGDSSEGFVVLPGMTTVDARQEVPAQFFLGHSFYAENRGLVSDMFLTLKYGALPDDRMLQRVIDKNGRVLWFIRD